MDMADAVNIMLYAVDEHGQEGTAVWDIFRSQDSNAIRDFLRKEFPPERHRYTDPIHSQHFFLTTKLRKKLADEHGVKSWRIYQSPGEAVFIPAGCAHQVCINAFIAIVFPECQNRFVISPTASRSRSTSCHLKTSLAALLSPKSSVTRMRWCSGRKTSFSSRP